jgi:hypothetical protein
MGKTAEQFRKGSQPMNDIQTNLNINIGLQNIHPKLCPDSYFRHIRQDVTINPNKSLCPRPWLKSYIFTNYFYFTTLIKDIWKIKCKIIYDDKHANFLRRDLWKEMDARSSQMKVSITTFLHQLKFLSFYSF